MATIDQCCLRWRQNNWKSEVLKNYSNILLFPFFFTTAKKTFFLLVWQRHPCSRRKEKKEFCKKKKQTNVGSDTFQFVSSELSRKQSSNPIFMHGEHKRQSPRVSSSKNIFMVPRKQKPFSLQPQQTKLLCSVFAVDDWIKVEHIFSFFSPKVVIIVILILVEKQKGDTQREKQVNKNLGKKPPWHEMASSRKKDKLSQLQVVWQQKRLLVRYKFRTLMQD